MINAFIEWARGRMPREQWERLQVQLLAPPPDARRRRRSNVATMDAAAIEEFNTAEG